MDASYRQLYGMNKEKARKQIVTTYLATGSISRAAHLWQTSRNVVRKWVRRFEDEGEEGLKGRLQRPHSSPRQTPQEVEQRVLEARRKTGYGRKRLAWYLVYVVSESGTVKPSKIVDTLKAMPLLPGAPIIISSCL